MARPHGLIIYGNVIIDLDGLMFVGNFSREEKEKERLDGIHHSAVILAKLSIYSETHRA